MSGRLYAPLPWEVVAAASTPQIAQVRLPSLFSYPRKNLKAPTSDDVGHLRATTFSEPSSLPLRCCFSMVLIGWTTDLLSFLIDVMAAIGVCETLWVTVANRWLYGSPPF